MSNPENTKEAPLSEEQPADEIREESLPEEKPVEETMEAPKAPEPTAIGDEKISILKHRIYIKSEERGEVEKEGVELTIKNVSDTTIGSAVFEAVLYDTKGNVLDTVEHKETELPPYMRSRTFCITSSGLERDKVASYNVRLVKTTMPPEPMATGNEKITILKHSLSIKDMDDSGGMGSASVDLAIRNVSDSTIATALFEAVFYDIEGNIVDTVKHREIDLKPSTSRGVLINSSTREFDKVKSYDIKVIRATTTDLEKVQPRRHEIITTEAGEEVRGTVKNISNVKTNAALVATFYDYKKENIGTKVIILRDIEPNSNKQFHFKFKPQEGDVVRTYTLNIGDIEE